MHPSPSPGGNIHKKNPCGLSSKRHHRRYLRRFPLVLLRLRPDTVQRFLLRETQTSTPLTEGSPTAATPLKDHHPCYSGLQVQGAANSPVAWKLYNIFNCGCKTRRLHYIRLAGLRQVFFIFPCLRSLKNSFIIPLHSCSLTPRITST